VATVIATERRSKAVRAIDLLAKNGSRAGVKMLVWWVEANGTAI
jgi:hypothetical protein